jgi:hypothetical protein
MGAEEMDRDRCGPRIDPGRSGRSGRSGHTSGQIRQILVIGSEINGRPLSCAKKSQSLRAHGTPGRSWADPADPGTPDLLFEAPCRADPWRRTVKRIEADLPDLPCARICL